MVYQLSGRGAGSINGMYGAEDMILDSDCIKSMRSGYESKTEI